MNIRFAEEKDFNSCVELDLHKNVNIIKNKIHMKEVIVAEHKNRIYLDTSSIYKLHSHKKGL